MDEVAKIRSQNGAKRTIPEYAKKYNSASNGVIERAVQSVEGMMRTARSAIEERPELMRMDELDIAAEGITRCLQGWAMPNGVANGLVGAGAVRAPSIREVSSLPLGVL